MTFLSVIPVYIYQIFYLRKFYALYKEDENFTMSRRARAFKFFLFTILIFNSVNIAAYTISDLVNLIYNEEKQWINFWRQITLIIFVLFHTLFAMGFLIIVYDIETNKLKD